MQDRKGPARVPGPAPLGVGLALLRALETAGIRHCHWKSNEHLAQALAGETDYDLLADAARAEDCRSLLRASGWKPFRSQPWTTYPDIEDWFGLDADTGALFHLHLHFALWSGAKYVKPWRLPFESELLARAARDPDAGVFTSDPAQELALLGLRLGVKTPLVRLWAGSGARAVAEPGLERELADLCARVPAHALAARATELLGAGDGAELAAILGSRHALERASVRRLRALARRRIGAARRAGALGTAALYLRGLALHAWGRVGRRLGLHPRHRKQARERGLFVALTGADGAGKSTLLAELTRWGARWFEVEAIYLGSGTGATGVAPALRRGLRRVEAPRRSGRVRDYAHAFFALVLARTRRRSIARAHTLARAGWLVLADRFPQNEVDALSDGPTIRARARGSRLLAWLGRREAAAYDAMARARPDLVVRLRIAPERAHERKPDHDLAVLREKALLAQRLRYGGARLLEIDASQSAAEVARQAKRGLWECW